VLRWILLKTVVCPWVFLLWCRLKRAVSLNGVPGQVTGFYGKLAVTELRSFLRVQPWICIVVALKDQARYALASAEY